MIKRSLAGVAALLAVASLITPWIAGSGSVPTLVGVELGWFRWALVAAVVGHLVGSGLWIAGLTDRVVLAAGIAEAGIAVVGLLLLEAAPGLLPGGVVVRTVRRSTVDIGAGIGPWLMLAAVALVVAAWLVPFDFDPRDVPWSLWWSAGGSVLVGVLLVDLRAKVWMSGSAGGRSVDLAGRELPWVGQLTLFLCLSFAVAASAYLLLGLWTPLLVPAALAWTSAAAAGVAVALSRGANAISVPGVSSHVQLGEVHPAPILYIVSCVAVAALIAAMIATAERSEW